MSGRACLLLICAALALSACGSGMSDLDRYIAEVKARKSKDIELIPQIKPYQPFEYTMTDRRDPFVLVEPRNEQANPNGPRPELRRNREALEEYRSEEHTSELQSLMRTSYAVFCLKKK